MYWAPFQVSVWSGGLRVTFLASLSRCNTSVILTLLHGSRKGWHSATRKPLTAVKAATASRPNYSFTTAETSGLIYECHSVTSITKIYGSIPGGLPHPPSCSTNPHGGLAAIFYLSSRRQPTSAPTRFSLSNHVSSSSGTPTYASLLH